MLMPCYPLMEESCLVLYDGYCKLCSRSVQWIIRNDVRKSFSFMSLQTFESSLHQAWKNDVRFTQSGDSSGDSVILQIKERRYERSSAVLRIAVRLRFPWPLLGIFFIVPPFLRDAVYNLVARNRRQWFGRHLACKVP